MGRKSNAKKAAREKLEEQGEDQQGLLGKLSKKTKKKSKKNLKKKGKSSEKPKEKKTKISLKKKVVEHKTNILSGAFTLIMLAILVSVGYLLFQKAFRATPITKFLPADQTIAVLDINLNFEHSQILKGFELLKDHSVISKKNIVKFAEGSLGLNYQSEIEPWLGRQAGVAIINSSDEENTINTIFFAEVKSKTNLRNFFQSKNAATNTYEGISTYVIDPGIYLAHIDDYIFISHNESELYEIIDLQSRKVDKLYSSNSYRRIDDNLPLNKIAYLYINFDKVDDSLFQSFNFLSEQGFSMDNLSPFLKVFESEGVALIAMDNNFAIHSFLSLDTDLMENIQNMTFHEKYTASLSELISDEAIIFWGGEDLSQQILRLIDVLSAGDNETLTLFNSVIDSYIQKYFGSEVDFYKDILPLFNNEFAYALEPTPDGINHHKFLFELGSPQENKVTIYELANNFATLGAIFEPKIVEHILADGTVAKELVAIPEEISKEESEYEGHTIYTLTMGQQGWVISYAIVDQLAILSTSEEQVETSLDLLEDNQKSLKNSADFLSQIDPVLKSSDEVSYFKVSKIVDGYFSDSIYAPIFQSIDSFSSGRNYFNDGVVTTNYLKVQ
jgi:hypothetical protein